MKDNQAYLDHILECISAILDNYFFGQSDPKELFLRDDKTRQATLHRLQTLGQAVKSLPAEVKQQISRTRNWREIAGFRDVLVHDYLGLDTEIVWSVVEKELPLLRQDITHYLEKKL